LQQTHVLKIIILVLFLPMIMNSALMSAEKTNVIIIEGDKVLTNNGMYKDNASADDYNTAGYRLYLKKQHADAKNLFRAAIEMNRKHVLAYYNLACVLALDYEKTREESQLTEVFHYLHVAIELDARRRIRALNDPDFTSIKAREEFYVVTRAPNQPELKKVYIMTFQSVSSLELELSVIFSDETGQTRYFKDDKALFYAKNLYTVKSENNFPVYTANQMKVNKQYKITIVKRMLSSGWSGMSHCSDYVVAVDEK
jgi:tetratricopeptide (TPR) repeat protein